MNVNVYRVACQILLLVLPLSVCDSAAEAVEVVEERRRTSALAVCRRSEEVAVFEASEAVSCDARGPTGKTRFCTRAPPPAPATRLKRTATARRRAHISFFT